MNKYIPQAAVFQIMNTWPASTCRSLLQLAQPAPTAHRVKRSVYYEAESLCEWLARVAPATFDDEKELALRKAGTNPFTSAQEITQ